MMNFSQIFKENEKITIPASVFMHMAYDATLFGVLERAYETGGKEGFSKMGDILFGPCPWPIRIDLDHAEADE